jgi:hypothetical protein
MIVSREPHYVLAVNICYNAWRFWSLTGWHLISYIACNKRSSKRHKQNLVSSNKSSLTFNPSRPINSAKGSHALQNDPLCRITVIPTAGTHKPVDRWEVSLRVTPRSPDWSRQYHGETFVCTNFVTTTMMMMMIKIKIIICQFYLLLISMLRVLGMHVKDKVKFALEQAMMIQRGSTGIALLFLQSRS